MIAPSDRKSKIWSVVRFSSGNFLEMYDFMVSGYYATAIGNAFFPAGKFVARDRRRNTSVHQTAASAGELFRRALGRRAKTAIYDPIDPKRYMCEAGCAPGRESSSCSQ